MNRILVYVAVALVLLATSWWGARWALNAEYTRGFADATNACQSSNLAALNAQITATQGLVAEAHAASTALSKSIAERQQADAQTTKELRDALSTTAPDRAGCQYDANSMQHIHTARQRAAQAVTSGIRSALPATGKHDE